MRYKVTHGVWDPYNGGWTERVSRVRSMVRARVTAEHIARTTPNMKHTRYTHHRDYVLVTGPADLNGNTVGRWEIVPDA